MEKIKLVCFDLDKTLIDQNSWYNLNLALGITHEEDQELFNEYNQGKFTYDGWMQKLLELFKRNKEANLKNISNILSLYTFKDGTLEVIDYLKSKGYKIALISGSINILVELVARDLRIGLAQAVNTFVFDENYDIKDIITHGEEKIAKLNILENFCRELGIDITECAAIGDGDNDIELFRKTGHGITFHGSHIEKESWRSINNLSELREIL